MVVSNVICDLGTKHRPYLRIAGALNCYSLERGVEPSLHPIHIFYINIKLTIYYRNKSHEENIKQILYVKRPFLNLHMLFIINKNKIHHFLPKGIFGCFIFYILIFIYFDIITIPSPWLNL